MRGKEVDIEFIKMQLRNGYIDITSSYPEEKEFNFVKDAILKYIEDMKKIINIPRRRVRRIYKQVKKILKQDGITDELEDEDIIYKQVVIGKIKELEIRKKELKECAIKFINQEDFTILNCYTRVLNEIDKSIKILKELLE